MLISPTDNVPLFFARITPKLWRHHGISHSKTTTKKQAAPPNVIGQLLALHWLIKHIVLSGSNSFPPIRCQKEMVCTSGVHTAGRHQFTAEYREQLSTMQFTLAARIPTLLFPAHPVNSCEGRVLHGEATLAAWPMVRINCST
jgi:hypothetical protein